MKTADVNEIKRKITPILKEEGVTRAALFGSVVRGEDTKESDIDVLVDVPRGTGLFEFIDLQHKLQEALGKKVDLVTFKSIHPLLKESILNEQVPIL